MMATFSSLLRTFVIEVLLILVVPPFVVGIWYASTGEHAASEQEWLNDCIRHLKVLREHCDDPQVAGVLDYTIRRYNRIGAWDVMILPCWSLPTVENEKTIGINWPLCPGLTIDPIILDWPIEESSMILVHEALHDYWPCFGHKHVDPVMQKVERL